MRRAFEIIAVFFLGVFLITAGVPQLGGDQDRARAYTRDLEFDYVEWTLGAVGVKLSASGAGLPRYVGHPSDRISVSDYLQVTAKAMRAEEALVRIYSDPVYADSPGAASHVQSRLRGLRTRQAELAPVAEAVLQEQVAEVAADAGLSTLGAVAPPVLFHTTSVPDALIVSPREEIRQEANISIKAGLPVDQHAHLESRVEKDLNVSALVVPIGGVGVYPTMIMQTTDRSWLTRTIAHEWIHNYLQFRPLGILYDQTPQLRTMNETTAEIAGEEIGGEVIRRFYSGLSSPGMSEPNALFSLVGYEEPGNPSPPRFDFRTEMHRTRITVDRLLASGRIVEAERYMEMRRRQFVAHGFFVRRLNQAYFAFYGAYADKPEGPAGDDPVGPAVRELRDRSPSLAAFVNRMAWMTSFEQLQAAVGE